MRQILQNLCTFVYKVKIILNKYLVNQNGLGFPVQSIHAILILKIKKCPIFWSFKIAKSSPGMFCILPKCGGATVKFST